ncbi:acetyltransferase [Ophiocordyceps sinensis CO18]|uniref:N-alpha-acetyltransferase 40 n=1 Tax=Ophiocordyceps sinensis (strain Co18 / CGMCC 3.14243) TaxID=911162 RepID=T5AL09_OPHSC|nr:acetyltransferase [Ophiocordyceps sinensis CO18]
MSNEAFVEELMRPSGSSSWPEWTHPRTGQRYGLLVRRAGELSGEQMEACFGLVQATSGNDYRASAGGWHPAAKRREMASPALRYVLVVQGEGRVAGFTSMMATFEGGEPVVYCYEIHLEPALQGTGLGRQLMAHVARAASAVEPVGKTMLTCFAANGRARRFYEGLGYRVDATSPRERRLRGGRVVVPDHVILSRPTTSGAGDGDGDARQTGPGR